MNNMLPREKAIECGISSLNDNELLALVLKSGYKNSNVFKLANNIIEIAGGFNNISSLTYEELISIKGIKSAKALEILAILEIAKRLSKINVINDSELSNPSKVIDWIRFNVGFSNQEEFFVIFLNARGSVIKAEVLFRGSKNSSIVAVDEVLRKALLLKSSGIVVAHNHPSDNVTPSKNDLDFTKRLYASSIMLGIPLLDHIIVSKSNYFSFKTHNLLC